MVAVGAVVLVVAYSGTGPERLDPRARRGDGDLGGGAPASDNPPVAKLGRQTWTERFAGGLLVTVGVFLLWQAR